jgi:predicted PurR-regulated permease PerM
MEGGQEKGGSVVRESWLRLCGGILLVAAGVLILWEVRGVVVTVLLAVTLAYALRPLVDLLCRPGLALRDGPHHLPRWLATAVVFLFIALVLVEIGMLSAPALRGQVTELQARWPRWQAELTGFANALEDFQQEQLPPLVRGIVESWQRSLGELGTAAARRGLGMTVHGVGLLVEVILVPIIAFYILADAPSIRQQVLFFLPRRHLPQAEEGLARADNIMGRYIKGQVLLCVIAFLVVTGGLWAIGVDFYLLLGLVAGVTRAIPIIGPLVGAIPIFITVMLTKSGMVAVWVLVLFTVMHILESKVLMPAVLGRQLGLHPVLIIVALLIGAEMGGLLGMFLAAPVLAAAKALVAERRAGPQAESLRQ